MKTILLFLMILMIFSLNLTSQEIISKQQKIFNKINSLPFNAECDTVKLKIDEEYKYNPIDTIAINDKQITLVFIVPKYLKYKELTDLEIQQYFDYIHAAETQSIIDKLHLIKQKIALIKRDTTKVIK